MIRLFKRSVFPILVAAIWLLGVVRLAWLIRETGGVAGWDYRIYATAAESAAAGIDPYRVGGIGTGFVNHPGLLLLVIPFARLGEGGVWLWIAGLIAGWALTLRFAGDGSWDKQVLLILLPLTAAVEGVFMGQASIPAGLCLAAAYLALRRDRDVLAGLVLALGVVFKFSLAAFGLFLLLKKRPRALAALAVGFAVFTLAAEWLLFPGVNDFFLETMVDLYAERHAGVHNSSLAGLPYFSVVSLTILAVLAVAILRTDNEAADRFALGGLAAWTLLVSPLTWHHHLVLLALPIAGMLQGDGALGARGGYEDPGRHKGGPYWIAIAFVFLIHIDLLGLWLRLPVHTSVFAAIGVLFLGLAHLTRSPNDVILPNIVR